MAEFTPAMDKELKAFAKKYRQLRIYALKQIDEEYKLNKKYSPYPQKTLADLLFFIPALVEDEDLTKAEGKQMTRLIQGRLKTV